ncbi:MAG: type II toxin-antitoxin system PemK/MazF family toxin [Bradyrhizobium sp.]
MPINFVPERGRILICDYSLARIAPENDKQRRVAVLSPRSYNERHGRGPGRCIVVPFGVTGPTIVRLSDVHFPTGPYRALSKDTWANCDSIMAVSHDRLDRVYIGHGRYSDEVLSDADLARVEVGIRHALGFPP